LLWTVCISLTFIPFINSFKYARTLTEDNTSKASKAWIESNLPAGSKILIDAGRTIISSGPRLHESRVNIERKLEAIRKLKDGETFDSPMVKIVDSNAAIYYELLLKTHPGVTYDITSTELGRVVESVDFYKVNKYNYFIHDGDQVFRTNDPLWRNKYPKSAAFYDAIDHSFTLIASFEPSPTRSGPSIKVYKIQ